jgi:universal stress protein E
MPPAMQVGGIQMVKGPERILVVVDPAAAAQPAVDRAAAIASRLNWEVELFVCCHEPTLPGGRLFAPTDREALRQKLLAHQLGYLRDLALRLRGLKVQTRAVWDAPLHEGIIRAALRGEPRLVMKDTHFQSTVSRALFTNTDWHLIRDCPTPLWLVRGGVFPDRPRILACLDPVHEHDKPASLDHRILEEARYLADGLGGDLHAIHCYDTTPVIAAAGAFATTGSPLAVEELAAEIQRDHAARFSEVATAHGIAPANTHLQAGSAVEQLPAAARQLRADLVVMGAVARSRLQHAIVGSTAERTLDRLACDVLVMKPARFESPVTYRPQAADFLELR